MSATNNDATKPVSLNPTHPEGRTSADNKAQDKTSETKPMCATGEVIPEPAAPRVISLSRDSVKRRPKP